MNYNNALNEIVFSSIEDARNLAILSGAELAMLYSTLKKMRPYYLSKHKSVKNIDKQIALTKARIAYLQKHKEKEDAKKRKLQAKRMNESYIPDFRVEATPATFAGAVAINAATFIALTKLLQVLIDKRNLAIKMKKDHRYLDKEIAKLKNRIIKFEKSRKRLEQREKKKGIRK